MSELTVQQSKEWVAKAKASFLQVIESSNMQLDWQKEESFAIQALSGSKYLRACTPVSIASAMFNVALTGLSLNPKLQHASLIPRKVKGVYQCVLDIEYKGYVHLMGRAGILVESDVIYENDYYEYEQGLNPKLVHRPLLAGDRGEMIAVYCVGQYPDGRRQMIMLTKADVEKIKKTAQTQNVWSAWPEWMWRKTAIKQFWKIANKNDEALNQLAEAIAVDNENLQNNFKKQQEDSLTELFSDAEEVDSPESNSVK